MPFSSRIPSSLTLNRLTTAATALRRAGELLLDLTISNPTVVGLEYPADLTASLDDPAALRYEPAPFGRPEARAAVASDLERFGVRTTSDCVVLTASTSEAYSHLFKLFCDPGDHVLVPAPSYPLFEHLGRLDSVVVDTYRLDYHGLWSIDREDFKRACGAPRVRAIVVVAPNNPTGSFLRYEDWHFIQQSCAARGLPVICDEVFIDYPLYPADDAVRSVLSTLTGDASEPLVVSLGGLSKSVGLPQHKLGWLILAGSSALVGVARERLEWICDTYLSPSTPIQVALPRLLEAGVAVRRAIQERLERNLAALGNRLARCPACSVLRVEGGWSAVIRVPSLTDEESLVLGLLEQNHVIVHPGYFFDFAAETYLVVSLLVVPEVFGEGIDRLCRYIEG